MIHARTIASRRKSVDGFSLIEMSIMLAVIGLLTVALLASGLIGREKYRLTETEEKMERIQAAIQVYYNRYGHLPCPASRETSMNTAAFGQETNCAAGVVAGVSEWTPTGGVAPQDDVRIGVVPTRALLLPDSDMFDEWGARFTYGVVKELAIDSTRFSSYSTMLATGVIEIRDTSGAPDSSSASDVNGFVLISHGADRKGAYSKSGQVGVACGTDLDSVNCDGGGTYKYFVNVPVDEDQDPADANANFTGTTTPYYYDLVRSMKTDELRDAADSGSSSSTSSTSGSDPTIPTPTPTGTGDGGGSGSGSSSGGPGGSTTPGVASRSCYLFRPVSADSNFGCAVNDDKHLYCWGAQTAGELGNGLTSTPSTTPAEVTGGYNDWTNVDTSSGSACGVRESGELYCWGDNVNGKLGNGTTTDESDPTIVSGGFTDWVYADAGKTHSCGLQSTARIYCWGSNAKGELGDGTTTESHTPVEVAGSLTNWAFVAAGESSSCGIRGGRVYCWGDNSYGQLGNGSTVDSTTPSEVSGGFADWARVWAGQNYACGLRAGRAYCWGRNHHGQLGTGGTSDATVPIEVSGTHTDWTMLTGGDSATCGLRGGAAYCWGLRDYGRIGDGGATSGDQTTPSAVGGGVTDYVSIATSAEHSCAARETGAIECWGRNENGEFGNAATTDSTSPTASAMGITQRQCGFGADCSSSFVEAAGSDSASYALLPDGHAYIWGLNTTGTFGNGTTTASTTPTPMGTYTDWFAIDSDAHNRFSCGIRKNGRLYCWGARDDYGVPDGGATSGNQLTPVEAIGGYNDWVELATDGKHGCARRGLGRLYCWGRGTGGRLGNGTATDYNYPVEVAGNFEDWSDFDVGVYYTCGIRNDGEAYCWGDNFHQQLGDGTSIQRLTPTLVAGGITDWKYINGDDLVTCGVTVSGRAYCWGENTNGQIGNGTTTNSAVPVEVTGAHTDWTFIKANDSHSCGIRGSGDLYCWGLRDYGRVGDGGATTGKQLTPILAAGGVTDWVFAKKTCASTSTGAIYCWGKNDDGEVGDGTTTARDAPVQVTGIANTCLTSGECTPVQVRDQVISADKASCVITAEGKLYCWGDNASGQIGDGTTTQRSSPVEIGISNDWRQVNSSGPITCGIRGKGDQGRAYCWGAGVNGAIGDGTWVNKSVPTLVSGGYKDWRQIVAASGTQHVCAARATGHAYCWGKNASGELGDGTAVDKNVPTEISGGFSDWMYVGGQGQSSCGIRSSDDVSGTAWCWGYGGSGAIGDGTWTDESTPKLVSGGYTDWKQLSGNGDHTCGLRITGQAYCWGAGGVGQLGDNTTAAKNVPTEISGAYTDWSKIAAGALHSCGIRGSGNNLYCWGKNQRGALGDNTTAQRNIPTAVTGVTNNLWSMVAAGNESTCAMKSTGAIYCWGYNDAAQIGDGTTTQRNQPAAVGGLTAPNPTNPCEVNNCNIQIRGGYGFSMALHADGKTYAWGGNTNGLFGDGTTLPSLVPTQAATTSEDWIMVSGITEDGKACGIRTNGRLYCWGRRAARLGDGSAAVGVQLTPSEVVGGYTDWEDVRVGVQNACARRTNGRLYCWGENWAGQVGDGSTATQPTPVEVSGAATDWFYLGYLNDTVCGIRGSAPAGTAYCWGENGLGEVGMGVTGADQSTPQPVSGGFTDWTMVNTDSSTVCGARSNGRAYCWGYNNHGQIGDNSTSNRNVPMEINGAHTDWQYIATGSYTSCGIRDGHMFCWGMRDFGEIGDGTTTATNQLTPTEVSGGFDNWYMATMSQENVCGARDTGEYYCWGRNDKGQVGDGSTTLRDEPAEVIRVNACDDGSECSSVSVRDSILSAEKTACVIAAEGTLYCWGDNASGQIGDGSTTDHPSPTQSGSDTDWLQVSSDGLIACGIRGEGDSGLLYCWGDRSKGALGDGGAVSGTQLTPSQVAGGFSDWRQVMAESSTAHVCATRANGRAYCWGDGTAGALGNNATADKNAPMEVNGQFTDWIYAGAQGQSSCGIRSTNGASGFLYCWGAGGAGQIGDGNNANRSVPTLVAGGFTDWTQTNGNGLHNCGLRKNGRAYCWGNNASGQLGDNTTAAKNTPTEINGAFTDWNWISAGNDHSCGIREATSKIYCWGRNVEGAIGDNTTVQRNAPVEITGVSNIGWSVVHAGNASSCGLKISGQIYCWGYNDQGQVGDGTTAQKNQPTALSDVSVPDPDNTCVGAACVPKHHLATDDVSCGIDKAGHAYCWGAGGIGQIGDNATANVNAPAEIDGAHGDWTYISATTSNACGVRVSGNGYCWGDNTYGQIGDNTTSQRNVPTLVGGSHSWKKIEIQDGVKAFACGVTASNEAYCWGDNSQGQLGDNSTTQRNLPTLVAGGYTDWIEVDTGMTSSCGIRSSGASGTLYCWGDNAYGQLGNGNTGTDSLTPIPVVGGHADWYDVSTGEEYAVCALRGAGHAFCWGDNTDGRLGTGTTTASNVPVEVYGAKTGWKVIASGDHTCGVRGGNLYCWGNNSFGELGDGTSVAKSFPTLISSVYNDWENVAVGWRTTCATRADNTTWCWGRNTEGALGDGTTANASAPVMVASFTGPNNGCTDSDDCLPVYQTTAGDTSCALAANNQLYCWGANASGQFGTGTATDSSLPVGAGGGFTDWAWFDNDGNASCGVRSNGDGYCWGDNTHGQLGDGTTTDRAIPTPIGGNLKWRMVDTEEGGGLSTSCGITTGKRLYCWGDNTNGKYGDNTTTEQHTPTPAYGGQTDWWWVRIQGANSTCGLRGDDGYGVAWCWGDNTYGQLGDGTTTPSTIPVAVSGGYTDWKTLNTTGGNAVCGVRSMGRAYCWGRNNYGQLGDASTTARNVPTEVNGASTDWSDIYAGDHSCGLRNGGQLYCWGLGLDGELGNGAAANSNVPVEVSGSHSDWRSISVGGNQSCGARSNGRFYCWGKGDGGQLGDGLSISTDAPTEVAELAAEKEGHCDGGVCNGRYIMAGDNFNCALGEDNRLYCWGTSSVGEFGDSLWASSYATPTSVGGSYSDWIQVKSGKTTVCGRRSNGRAYCWGSNTRGQVGDATTTNQNTPTEVSGNHTDWTWIDVTDRHSCGIRKGGKLYCWGQTLYGKLGDGVVADTAVTIPQRVGTDTDWLSVVASNDHTCGIRGTGGQGAAYCWGRGASGQTGDGATWADLATPTPVAGGYSDWTWIHARAEHSCGLRTTGQAYCWGDNANGQLGVGSTAATNSPVEVSGAFTNWTSLMTRDGGSCGIRGGELWCWGQNNYGQLGNGATTDSTVPVKISGGWKDWRALDSGKETACAVRGMGTIYCWGWGAHKEIGDGGTSDRHTPTLVTAISAKRNCLGSECVEQAPLSVGADSLGCVIDENDRLYCWGKNDAGEIGNGTSGNQYDSPTLVSGGFSDWVSVSAESDMTCGLRAGGAMYCWGINTYGGIGDNTTVNKKVPTKVSPYADFIAMDSDEFNACGIRRNGTLYCWGLNNQGAVGDASYTDRHVPTLVSGGYTDWASVVTGWATCGIRGSGQLYCWGSNAAGMMGIGVTGGTYNTPQEVYGAYTDWIKVSATDSTTCGIRSNSRAYCWGEGSAGEIGDGAGLDRNLPTEVSGAKTGWTDIASTYRNTCGINWGKIYCWGENASGSHGNNTATSSLVPHPAIDGISDFSAVSSSGVATCGLRPNGEIYCMGSGANGALASGGTANYLYPRQVAATTAKRQCDTCDQLPKPGMDGGKFLSNSGQAYTVGSNGTGAFGNGTTTSSLTLTETSLGGTNWTAFKQDNGRACGIKSGVLYCWGDRTKYIGDGGALAGNQLTPKATAGNYTDWVDVSAQATAVCGLRSNGQIWCFGDNTAGIYGNGATGGTVNTPTQAASAYSDFVALGAMDNAVCGLRRNGTLYCWGDDTYGSVGNNAAASGYVSTPALVAGGYTDWVSLKSGMYASICAIRANGSAYCWGLNTNAEGGTGSHAANLFVPTEVSGSYTDWQFIMGGYNGSCGIRGAIGQGRLYCWGKRDTAMIGDGGALVGYQDTPIEVFGSYTDWTQVAQNLSCTYGARANGKYYGWGFSPSCNGSGALGTGGTAQHVMPSLVINLEAPAPTGPGSCAGPKECLPQSLNSGAQITCVLNSSDGIPYCWGGNAQGQFGNGASALSNPSPIPAHGGTKGNRIIENDTTNGKGFTCVINGSNQIWCAGRNNVGQLGIGLTGGNYSTPQQEATLANNWKIMNVENAHSCAINILGELYCWGEGLSGKIGDGTGLDRNSPTRVGAASDWIHIGANNVATCGIRGTGTSGTAYCWGSNGAGQVGNGTFVTPVLSPSTVAGGYTDWTLIRGNNNHFCALRTNNRAYCWGDGGSYRLGNGGVASLSTPTEVAGNYTDWSYIAGGFNSSCGIRNGKLYCWGGRSAYGIPDGLPITDPDVIAPQEVVGFSDWGVMAPPANNGGCAARTTGEVYCWGLNDVGQVGDGTTTPRLTPVKVQGLNSCD